MRQEMDIDAILSRVERETQAHELDTSNKNNSGSKTAPTISGEELLARLNQAVAAYKGVPVESLPPLGIQADDAKDDRWETLITAAYNLILERDPDQTGLVGHASMLASGEMRPADLIRVLLRSEEARALYAARDDEPFFRTDTLPQLPIPSVPAWPRPRLQTDRAFEPRPDNIYHFHELSAYPDIQFIRVIYRALLKREPDQAGGDRCLELLRSGIMSKADLIHGLLTSEEGRQAGARVEGLKKVYTRDRLFKLPLIGYMLRLASALFHLPRNLENLNQNQRYNEMVFEQIKQGQRALADADEKGFETLETRIRDTEQRAREQLLNEVYDRLVSFHNTTRRRMDQLSALHQTMAQKFDTLEHQQQALTTRFMQEIPALEEQIQVNGEQQTKSSTEIEAHARVLNDLKQLLSDIQANVHAERNAREEVSGLAAHLVDELAKLRDRLTADTLKFDALERSASATQARIDDSEQRHQKLRGEFLQQNSRLDMLLEEARRRLPNQTFDQTQLEKFAGEHRKNMDALYVALEKRFRGTRDAVKNQVRCYLPMMRKHNAGSNARPILDIGCGRGEWLELLQESDLEGSGVDLNELNVTACKELGLKVASGDGITHMERLKDDVLGGVTAFHLIEHLPLDRMLRLFDQSLRVLKPGGIAIFETPNPENLLVGSCNFYLDPTHQKPIPPELAQFLMESRGFCRVEILRIVPAENEPTVIRQADFPGGHREWTDLLGPMNYAVVGYKA